MTAVDIFQDINHVWLNITFELKKHWNRRRIAYMAILAILLPLLFYVVPPAFGNDYSETANQFATINLNFVTLLVIISAAMFAGDAISSEFENKTGLLLFPTPQRKTSIFVGKYTAALLATWFTVMLYYMVTALEIGGIYGFDEISVEFAQSLGLSLLYSMAAVSVAYFFSSLMKRTITSTLLGFFFLMMIMPIFQTVMIAVDVEPWFMVTYSADLITNVFGGGSPAFGPGSDFANIYEPELNLGIYVMLAYALVLGIVSIFWANNRKME